MSSQKCDPHLYIQVGKWLAGILVLLNVTIGGFAFQMLINLDNRIDKIDRSVIEIKTIIRQRSPNGVVSNGFGSGRNPANGPT